MATAGDQYEFRTGNLWSVCNRDDVKQAQALLSEGLDIEMRNKAGWTPLHAAANGGAERVVSLLLREGAAIEARCRAGRTPLAEAARCGHLSTLKLLAKAGASLHTEDNERRRPLESASGTAVRTWLSARLSPADAVAHADSGASARTVSCHGSGKPERPQQGNMARESPLLPSTRREPSGSQSACQGAPRPSCSRNAARAMLRRVTRVPRTPHARSTLLGRQLPSRHQPAKQLRTFCHQSPFRRTRGSGGQKSHSAGPCTGSRTACQPALLMTAWATESILYFSRPLGAPAER